MIAPGALYAWLYKQYAEIKAEEITDIDDIANTKDKSELALLAREFYTDDHALWPEEKNDNAMPLSSSDAKRSGRKYPDRHAWRKAIQRTANPMVSR